MTKIDKIDKIDKMDERMSNPEDMLRKIGPDLKRSARNTWAEENEELIHSTLPYPCAYDITVGADKADFSQYAYTEFLGGLYLTTFSGEITCRTIEWVLANETSIDFDLEHFLGLIEDKYCLEELPADVPKYEKVVFLPGTSQMHTVDMSAARRLVFEEDNIFFKLHPLTSDLYFKRLAGTVGINRIIDKDMSGISILKNCTEMWSTSSSELTTVGWLLGKDVHNIGLFGAEQLSAYYAITSTIFKEAKLKGKDAIIPALLKIFNSPYSGIIFPFHGNTEERITKFAELTLNLKVIFKPRFPTPTVFRPKNLVPVVDKEEKKEEKKGEEEDANRAD